MGALKRKIISYAKECGFDLVRVTGAEDFADDRAAALKRIEDGHMDGLPWYTERRVKRGSSPRELLPGARSVISLGLSYLGPEESLSDTSESQTHGKVARYARMKDYHKAMKRRMRNFVADVSEHLQTPVAARWYVDDGPMLDRAAAARSGLGWFGKNTNILTTSHGSWVFLGQVITDLELEADPPLLKTCGSCVRCIDACPTGAIVAPFVIDNSRCISYLTIENRGAIHRALRPMMQDWVFGCDICQDVCPVNRKAQPAVDSIQDAPPTATGLLDLVELLAMTEDEFRERFQGTAVMRAKHGGMQRNACVALGNLGSPDAVPALSRALSGAPSPLVRGHAAWALGRIGSPGAVEALEAARPHETDPDVVAEIREALAGFAGPALGQPFTPIVAS